MSGIEQLEGCVATILTELRELRAEVKMSRGQEDMTRPLTAGELCERWKIKAATHELELLALRRRCGAWGLRPLNGVRGWKALYARAEVLRAESFANGNLTRRKHA